MMLSELPSGVVSRRAVVYVRQSTTAQVHEHLESQRRQYELVQLAQAYGFRDVSVIDDDLGRSAAATSDRPGFRSLVGQICEGLVGAVLCLEASRLARNGRDWHHLLELCGLVDTRVIDTDGAYDPRLPNDRLLLGLKGTMSEFELTLLRKRTLDAAVAKARRGELRLAVPIGYVWARDTGLVMDPDRRVQEAVRTVFRLFDRFGSARQVLLHMRREHLVFPKPADGRHSGPWDWRAPGYRNIVAVLHNPFYAGAYAYGKSQVETTIVEGTVRKAYGRQRPMAAWTALVRDHHDAYISWEQFEQYQERLARNAFGKRAGHAKAGRGGQALLAGLLRCRRCGRRLQVVLQPVGRVDHDALDGDQAPVRRVLVQTVQVGGGVRDGAPVDELGRRELDTVLPAREVDEDPACPGDGHPCRHRTVEEGDGLDLAHGHGARQRLRAPGGYPTDHAGTAAGRGASDDDGGGNSQNGGSDRS
jgi:DNA invertase Pin-like site-specific DNA recombinase